MSYKTITYEEFIEQFKPIKNPLDPHASFDGYMFETYGDEVDEVRSYGIKHIWTMTDGDNENMWITPGYGIVNRMGYMVTKVPWDDVNGIEVDINEYVSAEEARSACLKFWSDNGYEFEQQDVEDFFKGDRYSYGEVKYATLDFFEYVTTEDVPDYLCDIAHETFLDYL